MGLLAGYARGSGQTFRAITPDKAARERAVKQMSPAAWRGTTRPTFAVSSVSQGIGSNQLKALWARERCVLNRRAA